MKPFGYIINKVSSSEDGLTHCWKLPLNPETRMHEYKIQTDNKMVAKKLKGLEESAYGVNYFMAQFIVPQKDIDSVLRKAGLPPRRASPGRVAHGRKLGKKYKSQIAKKHP